MSEFRLDCRRGISAAVIICLLFCAAWCVGWYVLAHMLDTQRAYERWQGDSALKFAQVSCFLPVDEKISQEQVYSFRNEMQKKFQEAALTASDGKLFNDAWCTFGKVKVSGTHGSGEVSVTAVGGSFFDFHPLRLISGNYIGESDFMRDRVLLDEETAWLLFGGRDLTGMSLQINGEPFVVAGVIRREDDRISRKAYTSGMGIYMSYESYMNLGSDAADPSAFIGRSGISCYELIMAEPVSGFAYSVVSEKFPVRSGTIVKNSERYDLVNLLRVAKAFGTRSMQTQGLILPYWENAARSTEDWCTVMIFNAVLFALFPLFVLVRAAAGYGRDGREKLSDFIPRKQDEIKEAIRRQQRRRWEKQHPGWDRNSR